MEKFSSMVHWVQSEKMETFTQRMAVSARVAPLLQPSSNSRATAVHRLLADDPASLTLPILRAVADRLRRRPWLLDAFWRLFRTLPRRIEVRRDAGPVQLLGREGDSDAEGHGWLLWYDG